MGSAIDEILNNMKLERKRLALDLSRLDTAILALSSQESSAKQEAHEDSLKVAKRTAIKESPRLFTGRTKKMRESSVKWTFEVGKVFSKKNYLLPKEVVEELKANGVPGLDNTNTKKRVYATLNRKFSNKELFKNEEGRYFKK